MKITFPFFTLLSCALFAVALPAQADVSAADKKFAKKAAAGGMFEVKTGELAEKNAAAAPVKQFGAMMVTDHGKAGDELKAIAGKKGIKLPPALPEKLQKKFDAFSKLQGKEFDSAYVSAMVRDHEKDLAEFQTEAKDGSDPDLKAFADSTAKVIEGHLEAIKKIKADMK